MSLRRLKTLNDKGYARYHRGESEGAEEMSNDNLLRDCRAVLHVAGFMLKSQTARRDELIERIDAALAAQSAEPTNAVPQESENRKDSLGHSKDADVTPAGAAPDATDTPEVDEFYKLHPICEYEEQPHHEDCDAWLDFGRRLERERDAARRDRDTWNLLASQITTDWIPANRKLAERAEQAEAALEQFKIDGGKAIQFNKQRVEKLEDELSEEKKLSSAISRDCNNTANERNDAQAKLYALQKRLDDAGAEIARLCDLCHRAAGWVEEVRVDGNENERGKANIVEQLYDAARKGQS